MDLLVNIGNTRYHAVMGPSLHDIVYNPRFFLLSESYLVAVRELGLYMKTKQLYKCK